jgi:GDP-4-dehydro-6-deoxy-D-mannose reductase
MRAFVTGGHGFVGPWLVEHLRRSGDEVVVAPPTLDVTDGEGTRRAVHDAEPDAVYHLAAQSSVGSSWSEAARTFEVNATGTLHVLSAAQGCRPRPKVLLVSSSEVYGAVDAARLPVGETEPFRPVTPYAASKAAAELVGLQAFLGSGLEVLRVRPFNHTGPGQGLRFVVPALSHQVAEAARTGAGVVRTGNLAVRRDVADVRDVVRAYRLVVGRGCPGEVYNVCTGRSVEIGAIARRLLALAGVDLELSVDPARVRPVDVPDLVGDPTRVHAATGWAPEIPLDQTLADVLAYWRHAGTRPRV